MNRQMRRAKERELLKEGKFMSDVEMKEMMDKVKKESVKQASDLLFTSMMMVMRDEYGFGEKRLKRLSKEINEMLGDVTKGYLSLDDMKETLFKECNIRM